ncbi:MAG: metal-dependent hydrolase [Patescibacteria group bacterium]|nr:MAG: metal-dependent hydrolase [Patescibacteria group bacterium]
MKPWIILIAIILSSIAIIAGIIYIIIQKKPDYVSSKKPMDTQNLTEDTIKITPISHATMVLNMAGQVIYVDPVGGEQSFAVQEAPDLILITDIHFDHFDNPTLEKVSKKDTVLIVPKAVAERMSKKIAGETVILANGEKTEQKGILIEAIPMYNIPESPQAFHTKGRGNGYVLEAKGERVYIAGDTSNIPEMRALKNIDIAFIPMNLPYTMTVEEAAEAVVAFKPKIVHPYHYRGEKGFSDINKFKELVNKADPSIKVELLNFYPNQ